MIPRFYRHWIAPEGRYTAPDDSSAFDCRQCYMLKPSGLTRDLGPFKQNLKCCTFQPFLPSFTLGALLLGVPPLKAPPQEPLLKQQFVNAALDQYFKKSRLTPLGAFPRTAPTSICETGRSNADACCFLSMGDEAECTIRDYRPSTCAAYVCRSNMGALGLKAWRKWEFEIKEFEWTLAHLAGYHLGYTLDDIEIEFSDIDRAREFYILAYHEAMKIDPYASEE